MTISNWFGLDHLPFCGINHKNLPGTRRRRYYRLILYISSSLLWVTVNLPRTSAQTPNFERQKISLNSGWKFFRYSDGEKSDNLIYDQRPDIHTYNDNRQADERPTEALERSSNSKSLKAWILPTGNDFLRGPQRKSTRPAGNPGSGFDFVQPGFNDKDWENVNLPHDWAITQPFYKGWNTPVGGGMGRLPSHGVAWYRKKISIPASDQGKSIFLDIDGAMSYAMVWVNNKLVGGWPYGYASWRLDITPFLKFGTSNQLAIRLDNPPNSSRWYPGGGIYRNVWLVKTAPIHIGHWGVKITTPKVSEKEALVTVSVNLSNDSKKSAAVRISAKIYPLDANGQRFSSAITQSASKTVSTNPGAAPVVTFDIPIPQPRLWGPLPDQTPNMYLAVVSVFNHGKKIDTCETAFGIRDIKLNSTKGLLVNNRPVRLNGVNQHHDLGPLGAAFNIKAAERQLKLLKEAGCNAIRMAHNPPAPELLDLTDRMGFLVINEIFDSWELKKTPLDFHLIFPDWHEQDLRAFIRRDFNHPSIFLWSIGNEVGEQYTGEKGAALARVLTQIAKEEDNTRPITLSMNYAKPGMPITAVPDIVNLNYQGEGIRNGGAYQGLKGISTPPLFPSFHSTYPDKMIISSENAATVSSRGEYFFPVYADNSAPVKEAQGGDSLLQQVSSYDLYTVEFGASPDKVFATMEQHPFVAGGFVWSGWDYLGEPTPYYLSRSSYFGIIDLAGFKKDRFYLYQSHWRPNYPMAHILPHWNWSQRTGQITPVHVYTSGDEAELFLNGKSLGKKKKQPFTYRLRWDDVVYQPGKLKVIAYKNGAVWATDSVITTGKAADIHIEAGQTSILADGNDLAFITVRITDKNGLMVPDAKNELRFSIEGPGEIVATDNGDAADLTSFASSERRAFNGRCLVIVRANKGTTGNINLTARSAGLISGKIYLRVDSRKLH